jgi:hypothetical protein
MLFRQKKNRSVDNVIEAIEERDNNLYRTYFNTSPIPKKNENLVLQMWIDTKRLQGYDNSKLVLTTTKKVDILQRISNTIQIAWLYFKTSKEKTNYYLPFLPFNLSEMKI